MAYTVEHIATRLQAAFHGDGTLSVDSVAEPASAGQRDLALALTPAYAADLARGQAQAAILWPGADWQALGLKAAIIAPRGRLAMARLTGLMDAGPDWPAGIHPTALIDPTAQIGADVAIGPFCVIGAGVAIGQATRIGAYVSIGAGAQIGPGGIMHPGVRIGQRVQIGARVILHPNVVIGADGFSFVTATPSYSETARLHLGRGPVTVPDDPTWHRIHSLGGVIIGDDVEIGAGSTVDAGTIRPTQVGRGTKIDNLVQVGHNVVIGQDCLLCAQVGVAGSSVLGDRVVLGGKTGVADNLTIGSDVVTGGGTIVLSNVASGRVMMGYPAVAMDSHIASYKALRRLPRWMARQNADGQSADGQNADGQNSDGQNADGQNADGQNAADQNAVSNPDQSD